MTQGLHRGSANPGECLQQLVQGMLLKHGISRRVALTDQLTDIGLSSLDMANLMFAIEAEFDLTIPSSDLTAANFRSIASLERLIVHLSEAARPADPDMTESAPEVL